VLRGSTAGELDRKGIALKDHRNAMEGSRCQRVVSPGARNNRRTNISDKPYEEITVFFLSHPDDIAQPDAP